MHKRIDLGAFAPMTGEDIGGDFALQDLHGNLTSIRYTYVAVNYARERHPGLNIC